MDDLKRKLAQGIRDEARRVVGGLQGDGIVAADVIGGDSPLSTMIRVRTLTEGTRYFTVKLAEML